MPWPTATGDEDFAPYLCGRPDGSVALFRRFVDLARARGPVTFELQPGRVVLRGTRRIFAAARVTDAGIDGHLNLARQVSDRRIGRVEPLTNGCTCTGTRSPRSRIWTGSSLPGWTRRARSATVSCQVERIRVGGSTVHIR
jgi:hypothetical protein